MVVNPQPLPSFELSGPPPRTSPLFSAQFKMLQSIDDFVARKDENELRETFDFPNMLKYNIKLAKSFEFPNLASSEVAEVDAFFKGGQGRLDLRYLSVSPPDTRKKVSRIPGKIGMVNTSVKYINSRHMLMEFYSSSQLPSKIAAGLKALDKAVDDNMTLMIESLNESLRSDPRNISENDDGSSNFYASAYNLYWTKFIPLKEKADAVSSAIREYLGVR